MRFRRDAQLDTSQIGDRRGARYAAGGGLGIVGLLVALLLGVNPMELGGAPAQPQAPGPHVDLAAECRTGEDANEREDCRIVGVVNSVQEFWDEELPRHGGRSYELAQTNFFSGGTQTGCGSASSAVGPFYCPTDSSVYFDLSFFEEMRTKLGARGGPFAQAYVVAHEYGHHVQNLLGTMQRVGNDREGPQSGAVRLELQADCYAGAWAKGAVATGFVEELTQDDIRDGLDAAAAIGDDRLQERFQGRVTPESWTHGSSEQRQRWFSTGYRDGVASCDTFRGSV